MNKKNIKIAILGAGNMGTTLAQIIASNGYQVTLWNHEGEPEPLEHIKNFRENKKYLPSIKLSSNILPEPILEKALQNARIIFLAVPSGVIVKLVERLAHRDSAKNYGRRTYDFILVDISKGFREIDFDKKSKMSVGVARSFKNMVIISGPAVAADLIKGGFTAMNIAGRNKKDIKLVQEVLENDFVKLLPTTDVMGIKLCGAMKNVYAILLGMCDGLGLTLNTKAFLLTLAVEEMSRLIVKLGGQKSSVISLSGLGDLIGTGLNVVSRNRRFGELLISASSKKAAEQEVGQVVEGIRACKMAHTLAKRFHLHTPLLTLIYRISWQEKNPQQEIELFLKRFSS